MPFCCCNAPDLAAVPTGRDTGLAFVGDFMSHLHNNSQLLLEAALKSASPYLIALVDDLHISMTLSAFPMGPIDAYMHYDAKLQELQVLLASDSPFTGPSMLGQWMDEHADVHACIIDQYVVTFWLSGTCSWLPYSAQYIASSCLALLSSLCRCA